MNISPGTLTELRQTLHRAQKALRGGQTATADELLITLGHSLERLGADTPYQYAHSPAGKVDPNNVPLHLCTSPANQRYARALREAHTALLEVEAERGWSGDGPSDLLIDWVEDAEAEAFGVKSRLE